MLVKSLAIGLAVVGLATGLDLDANDVGSIQNAQNLVVKGLMDYYNGNDSGGTPGMFQQPYYWWEAGVAWGSLLDYTYYTGNDSYEDLIQSSLLYQVGDKWDYMPSNQTTTEGNDDQGFWGVTVMAAAEKNFTNPGHGRPGWLYLAQAVFNTMASRWKTHDSCNGGLRWQIFPWNAGYSYKNTVGTGCMFHIGARLARYTSNHTYEDWCEKIWDWTEGVKFIDDKNQDFYYVYDGADIKDNCTDIKRLEWTYNYGLFMAGAAYLYNHTGETKWLDRATRMWKRCPVFFDESKVMYEAACQPSNRCNTDQRCFKGIFSRFLGLTALMIPDMAAEITEYIKGSAVGMARSCSGGSDGHTCGLNWLQDGWDGQYGLGEQISALDLMNTLLIHTKPGPLTAKTGGSSKGDGSAGSQNSGDEEVDTHQLHISTKDKAGAGIITVLVIGAISAASGWLLF